MILVQYLESISALMADLPEELDATTSMNATEKLQLDILLSQSPEAAYNQLDILFDDEELFSTCGDPSLERHHQPSFLESRDYFFYLSHPPPPTNTVALLFDTNAIGKILLLANSHGLVLTGLKQVRATQALLGKLDASQKPNSNLCLKMKNALEKRESFIAICFSGECAAKKALGVYGIFSCTILIFMLENESINDSGFESILSLSSSYADGEHQKVIFFPEGTAVSVIDTTPVLEVLEVPNSL